VIPEQKHISKTGEAGDRARRSDQKIARRGNEKPFSYGEGGGRERQTLQVKRGGRRMKETWSNVTKKKKNSRRTQRNAVTERHDRGIDFPESGRKKKKKVES